MTLFHALNRGVDKRELFLDEEDYIRFIHDLYVFNDVEEISPNHRFHTSYMDNVSPYIRSPLVTIHGWCLMDNHYHLLLSELVEGGLRLFLRRLNVGYAKYFNEKYKRIGVLFQGRTKKIPVNDEAHFLYILHYIHLNPLDLLPGARDWRTRDGAQIQDMQEALAYLTTYRWSSYLDYVGTKNFPSLIDPSFFNDALDGYAESLQEFLWDRAISQLPYVLE
ncbi:MAG: hypothetical protein V4480_04705 [Patescibacteria group bacterium]